MKKRIFIVVVSLLLIGAVCFLLGFIHLKKEFSNDDAMKLMREELKDAMSEKELDNYMEFLAKSVSSAQASTQAIDNLFIT